MVHFEDDELLIRNMEPGDVRTIVREETAQGDAVSVEKYDMRLRDQAETRSVALVAVYHGAVAGYIHVYREAGQGPFAGTGIPEIVDFGVLEKYRKNGIGTRLMDVAERLAWEYGPAVCLGVGLHSGYGSAQRLYAKRGYLPDGSGVWYRDAVCEPYTICRNDDDLILYLSKVFDKEAGR